MSRRSSATPLVRPRRRDGRILAGVCAGLADRFGLSRFLVRVAFVVFGLFGAGEIVYLVLCLIMPSAPRDGGSPLDA